MQPNFATLKPVDEQPNFQTLRPVDSNSLAQNGEVQNNNTTNDGFLSSLIKDPIKTLLVRPAIRTAQAVAGVAGVLTGNENLQNNANQGQTFDIPVLGKYYIEGQKKFGEGGATQIASNALESASYLAPVGRAEAAGSSLVKGKILKAVASGSLAGGQFGLLSGASHGLQQDNPTFGGVLENSLLEGLFGSVLGGISGGTLATGSKAIRGITDFTGSIVKPYIAGTELGQKYLSNNFLNQTKENLYQKLGDTNAGILNLTKTQINNETKFAKDTPLFIAREAPGVPWDVTKDGRLNTQTVIDALEPKYHAEAQAFNLALKDSGEYASLDVLQKDAEAVAKEQFKGTAQDDALAKIDAEILAYKKQYASSLINHNGETIVPIHILDDIKSDLWGKTKFYGTPGDALLSQTNYLMGNSAKNIIENTVKDSPIKAWNQRLGDFASAIKILNQRNGIRVGAGAYSSTGARILGGLAGQTLGGIPGEIAGMVTADQLLKVASDPNVKSYVFKKLLQKMQENGQQGIIDEVQKVMEQRALERGSRRALPPASYIPLGAETPPPSGVKLEQAKAISIQNPKTGKFERAFTSETKPPKKK